MPLISVAMATYNGERFLREQIDSILAQTHQNFELVICDDCSTDGTAGILREYETQDSRVHVYVNEINLGFKKNFERAISLCKGEYIALSDQDDVWLPEHLEKLLRNIGTKGISGGNAELVDATGDSMGILLNEVDGFLFMPEESKFLWRILLLHDPIQGASMLLTRDFARKCLPIPEKVLYHDAWFAACACLDGGIAHTFDVITKYRQHGKNVTFSSHNDDTRTLIQRIRSKARTVLLGARSDRFHYIDELRRKYAGACDDFQQIAVLLAHIRQNRVTPKDVAMLWKNYENIMTRRGHRHFLKRLVIWLRWRPC